MSVLENNSTKMADILAAVNALPDAGSGGGGGSGSVETCTVQISGTMQISAYLATVYINNEITVSNYRWDYGGDNLFSVTIENVVCGSGLTVHINGGNMPDVTITNGELLTAYANAQQIHITAGAGETVTIVTYDAD